jgi:hypothetical protein
MIKVVTPLDQASAVEPKRRTRSPARLGHEGNAAKNDQHANGGENHPMGRIGVRLLRSFLTSRTTSIASGTSHGARLTDIRDGHSSKSEARLGWARG